MAINVSVTIIVVNHQPRIALVEDDLDLLLSTQEFLVTLGFQVWGATSAEAFFRHFSAEPADVVVLDIGLPGEDGLSVAELLRTNRNIAIIILSAHDSLDDRLAGMRAGADRYLVKPVNLLELAANIEAVISRLGLSLGTPALALPRPPTKKPDATEAHWSLAVEKWVLSAPSGKSLPLSSREFILMYKLISSQGQVVPKKDLINTLFGTRHLNGGDRINVLLTRLRKKALETLGIELPLKTAHLVGYAFVAQARLIEQ